MNYFQPSDVDLDNWAGVGEPWFPTHEIRIGHACIHVMELDGTLYTKQEWESGNGGGAWVIDGPTGVVLFQNRVPKFDFSVRCLGRVFG